MTPINIQEIRTVLARHPQAEDLPDLDDTQLLNRLAEITDRQLALRPSGISRHRVGDLLRNLAHLRPGPRSVVSAYLFENLDLSPAIDDAWGSEEDQAAPISPPTTDPTPPASAADARDAPAPEAAIGLQRFRKRPPDLFDRVLDWIAALVK